MNAYADAAALLRDLRARGVHLEPRGDRLHYRAPAGALTAALKAAMAAAKAAILLLLRREALDAACDAWEAHARRCTDGCAPARLGRCAEGERLAGAYFEAWAAWLAAADEEVRRQAPPLA